MTWSSSSRSPAPRASLKRPGPGGSRSQRSASASPRLRPGWGCRWSGAAPGGSPLPKRDSSIQQGRCPSFSKRRTWRTPSPCSTANSRGGSLCTRPWESAANTSRRCWGVRPAAPLIRIDLELSALPLNISGTNFDIAIRVGGLSDSRLKAKLLAQNRRIVCASPSYLDDAPPLKTTRDLEQHNCIVLRENNSRLLAVAVWRQRAGIRQRQRQHDQRRRGRRDRLVRTRTRADHALLLARQPVDSAGRAPAGSPGHSHAQARTSMPSIPQPAEHHDESSPPSSTCSKASPPGLPLHKARRGRCLQALPLPSTSGQPTGIVHGCGRNSLIVQPPRT